MGFVVGGTKRFSGLIACVVLCGGCSLLLDSGSPDTGGPPGSSGSVDGGANTTDTTPLATLTVELVDGPMVMFNTTVYTQSGDGPLPCEKGPCLYPLPVGTPVTLSASPAQEFFDWIVAGDCGFPEVLGVNIQFVLDADCTARARFGQDPGDI